MGEVLWKIFCLSCSWNTRLMPHPHTSDKSCHDIVDVICASAMDFTGVLKLNSRKKRFCSHLIFAQSCNFYLSSSAAARESVCLTGRSLACSVLFHQMFACINFTTELQQAVVAVENEFLIPVGLDDTVKPPKRFLSSHRCHLKSPSFLFLLVMLMCKPVASELNKASSFHWLCFSIQRISAIFRKNHSNFLPS